MHQIQKKAKSINIKMQINYLLLQIFNRTHSAMSQVSKQYKYSKLVPVTNCFRNLVTLVGLRYKLPAVSGV